MLLTLLPEVVRVMSLRRRVQLIRRTRPATPSAGAFRRGASARELGYASVRVRQSARGFELCYAEDGYKSGTGPFATRAEAIRWFERGGR